MKLLHIFLFSLPLSLWSQSIDVDSLDRYISKLVSPKEYNMPGLAIGVIHNDTVIFKKGYGTTRNGNGLPIHTETIFPILSCTKAFTATCIGILVDEGRLDWNDKVVAYLPDFKLSDPWITNEITISDLLSHRSGLGEFDGDSLWYSTDFSSDEIIEKIQYYPVRGSFRLDFNYNNVMYIVAGKIIEKVTGLTWNEFLKTKIFDVLDMKNSSSTLSELTKNPEYAHPHIADKPIEPRSIDNAAPAGGINSTIDDMLLWLQMYLNKGALPKKKIISQKTFETITNPKMILDDRGQQSYGFGWYIDYEDGQKSLYHGGGMPGYKSMVALYPEHNIGIVVLTNKISMINEGLVNMISTYIKHPELTDWSNNRKYFTYFGYSWDNPKKMNRKSSAVKGFLKYTGLYEDKVYGKASISIQEGIPTLKLLPNKELFSGTLYYASDERFKVKLRDEFLPIGDIVFEINEEGAIKGFRMEIPTGDFHFDNLHFSKIPIDSGNMGEN
ncbi:serine hydrolase [Ulvibacterium sp.]|uniref:serine hydrolase n=1 Tax=Ulvibacterium sp. TaxID=2665914 RepID=UPI003BA894C7